MLDPVYADYIFAVQNTVHPCESVPRLKYNAIRYDFFLSNFIIVEPNELSGCNTRCESEISIFQTSMRNCESSLKIMKQRKCFSGDLQHDTDFMALNTLAWTNSKQYLIEEGTINTKVNDRNTAVFMI